MVDEFPDQSDASPGSPTKGQIFWKGYKNLSLVAHRFRRVAFRISTFYSQAQLKKIKTKIQNSTHPNRWAVGYK